MTAPRLLTTIVLAGLLLFLAIGAVERYSAGKIGEARAAERAARAQASFWKDSAGRAVAQVRTDSVKVTRTVTRYEALRDTLRLSDTVWVKEVIAAADTAVRECRALVTSCSLAISAKDSQLVALERQNAAIRKMIPGRTSRALSAAKWLVVGGAVGVLLSQ